MLVVLCCFLFMVLSVLCNVCEVYEVKISESVIILEINGLILINLLVMKNSIWVELK